MTCDGHTEHLRPRYHLTPRRHWLNDPNGLVHHDGRWHLFFQHNPEGNDWGNMSWGHASSPDLVHWTEHPVALRHREGEAVFSGSAVVDGDDLAAIHTSVYADGRQAQSLARSTDGGLTWTSYAGNPVLDRGSTDFRDPKVFRHGGRWLMVAVEAVARQVLLHESDDLVHWRHLSTVEDPRDEGVWECPDLVELPVEGQPGRTSWVLVVSVLSGSAAGGSGTRYLVGDFDGTTFTAHDRTVRWLDHGRDHYAGVTWEGVPDGRQVMVGWLSNWDYAAAVPTSPWRGGMTLPRDLTLREHDGKLVLVQRPAPELDALADGPARPVDGSDDLDGGAAYRLRVVFTPDGETGLDLCVGPGEETRLRWRDGTLTLDRRDSGDTDFHPAFPSVDRAPVPLRDGRLDLDVWVDRTSVEVFAQDGRTCLTQLVFPSEGSTGIRLVGEVRGTLQPLAVGQ